MYCIYFIHAHIEVQFKVEPHPYYYSYTGRTALILCAAVKIDNSGNEIPVSATLYLNSERINPVLPPERHHAYAPVNEVIEGVIVSGTVYNDTGNSYVCTVEERGEERARSRSTKLLVGGEECVCVSPCVCVCVCVCVTVCVCVDV